MLDNSDQPTITERLSQINSYIEQLHAEHAKTRQSLTRDAEE